MIWTIIVINWIIGLSILLAGSFMPGFAAFIEAERQRLNQSRSAFLFGLYIVAIVTGLLWQLAMSARIRQFLKRLK